MSTLLYLPFSTLVAAQDFQISVLRYMAAEESEVADACLIMRDQFDRIYIQYNQLLTSKGLIGAEFWEVLIMALLSKPQIGRFDRDSSSVNLSLHCNHPVLQDIADHLQLERSAIILLLRNTSARFLSMRLKAVHPSTLRIPFTDQDDLAIQQTISRKRRVPRSVCQSDAICALA